MDDNNSLILAHLLWLCIRALRLPPSIRVVTRSTVPSGGLLRSMRWGHLLDFERKKVHKRKSERNLICSCYCWDKISNTIEMRIKPKVHLAEPSRPWRLNEIFDSRILLITQSFALQLCAHSFLRASAARNHNTCLGEGLVWGRGVGVCQSETITPHWDESIVL